MSPRATSRSRRAAVSSQAPPAAPAPVLAGRRVALSVSDSPDGEVLGVRAAQQERTWGRLVAGLLSAGAEVAYGGDLRPGGYTRQLEGVVRELAAGGFEPAPGSVHAFVPWPVAEDAPSAALPPAIRVHTLPRPAALPPDRDATADALAWALSMREVRAAMGAACDARILVGGAFVGRGPLPGVVEEFLADVGSRPIYLAGAFGGATRLLVRALLGDDPFELSEAFQRDAGRRGAAPAGWGAASPKDRAALRVDHAAVVSRLQSLGTGCLANGLTDEENGRLFWSGDPFEITALILAGLERALGPAPRA